MTKAAELAKMGEVLTNSQIGGRRNILYNSKFEVAQRGTSFSQGTGTNYLLDRWRPAIGSAFNLDTTISQSTTVPSGQGFKHSLKVEADSVVSPTSIQNGGIAQYLEGQDVDHLAYGTSSAESLTLSFWVRSNKTGTYCVQLMMNMGAGSGSERQMHIKEYTISSANTWEKKILTFTGNTSQAITQTNTDGFRVIWWLSTGSGDHQSADSWISSPVFASTSNQVNFMDSADNEWYLCGCQLEVGEQATPFEHRSYGEELALCQRYCQLWGEDTTVAGVVYNNDKDHYYPFTFPEMRTRPSVTFSHNPMIFGNGTSGTYAITAGGSNNDNRRSIRFQSVDMAAGSQGQATWFQNTTAGSYFLLEAEL